MKQITFISFLMGLLVLSCKSPVDKDVATAEAEETPQWVTYTGDQGPGEGKHIVLVSGDEEYRSEEALPLLGRILAKHHGFTCTVLFAQDPLDPGTIRPKYLNNIPGMDMLDDADLMVLFTRFRDLPDDQMQHFEKYLLNGKPLIGIRTATHAFNIENPESQWQHYSNSYEGEMEEWTGGFGRLVLGEKWISHHGHHKHQSTRGLIAPGATDHPIARGLQDGDVWGPTDVYGVRLPLPGDAQPIVLGQVVNRTAEFDEADALFGMRIEDSEVATANPANEETGNPNDPMMPVAWTKSYQIPQGQQGRIFGATIGASTDLITEGTRRLYVNAVYWLLNMEVPESSNVDIVGTFNPTAYSFMSDEYWEEKQLKVSDFVMEEEFPIELLLPRN